jgi:hypothetical protein
MPKYGIIEPTDVMEAHYIDEQALAAYLHDHIDGFGPNLIVRQFPIGQSNPTYQLISGGNLTSSAHSKIPGCQCRLFFIFVKTPMLSVPNFLLWIWLKDGYFMTQDYRE